MITMKSARKKVPLRRVEVTTTDEDGNEVVVGRKLLQSFRQWARAEYANTKEQLSPKLERIVASEGAPRRPYNTPVLRDLAGPP